MNDPARLAVLLLISSVVGCSGRIRILASVLE